MAFHGLPRYTADLDLLIGPGADNGARLLAVLAEFGFGSIGISAEDLQTTGPCDSTWRKAESD